MAAQARAEADEARPVGIRCELDKGIGRNVRIGLIVLSTDLTSEREFRRMVDGDEIAFFVSRIPTSNPVSLENQRRMADHLAAVTALILPDSPLDVVAYACTSGTLAIGVDTLAARIRKARPGIPCATPITGACEAVASLGMKRVALLTPYTAEVTAPIRNCLEENGFAVAATAIFDLESDADMARIPPTEIRDAAVALDRPDIDGIFISCTALRVTEVIAEIEARIGKPVVTSNQALLWQALRRAGYSDPISGFGRLLEL